MMSDGIDKTINDKNKCRECMEEPFYQCKDNPCNYRFQKPTIPSKYLLRNMCYRSKNKNTNDLFNLDDDMKDALLDSRTWISTLNCLSNQKININRLAINNIPILAWACKKGYRDLVEILLSNGTDPNIHDKKNGSLIENAVKAGCTHIIDMLIEYDYNLDDLEEGIKQNCLYICSYPKMMKYLLHLGFNPNASGRSYRYRDISACFTTSADNLELLLSHGADVKSATRSTKTIANHIIQTMPPSFNTDTKYRSLIDRLFVLFKYIDVEQCEKYEYSIAGRSLLHTAASQKNIFYLEYLLKLGLDPNCREFNTNWTPLHIAALHTMTQTKLLLSYGAHVEAIDRKGNTPLHFAVQICSDASNKHDDVRDLLLYGARSDVANFAGQTAISVAVNDDDDKSIEWMLLFGANLFEIVRSKVTKKNCLKVNKMLANYLIIKTTVGIFSHLDVEMNEKLKKFEDDCKDEVALMKILKIPGSEIYYIDLLLANRRKLAKMAFELPAKKIVSSYILRNFGVYANWLLKNVYLGIIYGPVYEKSTQCLYKIFDSKLPLLAIDNIINYLNFADMKNLIDISQQLNN